MKHVAIIGGGIAGLSTALRLLRKGYRVTVFEKQKGPVDKVCGEGILPFGVALLRELGLDGAIENEGRKFAGLTYYHGSRKLEARFQNGQFGLGIDRSHLDRVLRSVCTAFENFEYRQGQKVDPLDVAEGHDGVLGADGVQGKTARWLGRVPEASPRLGVRFRLSVVPEAKVSVHFFREGEIYLTPTGPSTLSVAMLLNRKRLGVKGKDLKAFCLAFFRKALPQYADQEVQDFATRGNIAVSWRGSTPSRILMGDALRAYDPISGAGMSFALLCGKMATVHLDDPKKYYRAMGPAMAAIDSYTNLVLFFSGGGLRTRLMFRQLGKTPALFERLIDAHDGKHRFVDLLDWQTARQILRV